MRSLLGVAIVLLAGCPASRPTAPKDPADPRPTTLDPARIDKWIAAELARREVVGASLVIVYEGATILSKGYGTRVAGKSEPIDADTPFAIGSISKQLTCAALMTLADEGKLSLKDPVSKWYPNLVRAADITLDDLGSHMSGYRDYYPLDYLDGRMTTKIAPDDLIARYAGLPLDFEPRTRWSYSNTGFVLLGRIIEKVTGKQLGAVLEERIFSPLGMTHSSVGSPPPGAALGHNAFMLGPTAPTAPEADGWLMGTAGVYSSASDLAKWDLALGSGALLTEGALKQMTSPHRTIDGREMQYGCGIGLRVAGGERVLQHTGAIEGYLAYNTAVPRIRAAVILLTNDNKDVGDLHQKIVSLVLDRPGDIPVVPGPGPEDTARALIKQLQAGALDRSRLGEDLNGYFDDKRLAEAAPRLRALGEPTKITLVSRGERGAMEVTHLEIVFAKRTLQATMFRSPVGKVHQFVLKND